MKVSVFLVSLIFLSACATRHAERGISSHESPAETSCDEKIVKGTSDVQKCYLKANGSEKKFFIFKGQGTAAEIQFSHGYLLAEQINQGSIEEMKGHFAREEERMGKNKWLFNSLKDCQMKRLKKSVSVEFMKNISAISAGYIQGMKDKGLTPKYNEEDFIFTLLGIEFGNVMGGIAHQSEESAVKALGKVIGQCGLKLAGEGIKEILKNLRKDPPHEKKMGCVGLIAPESATGNGLIHGRNLDQGPLMKSWSKAPVLYLIHEKGMIPYVAPGTAGLIYPGGISGYNEHGISVSLHQMNTTTWDTKHPAGSAEVVPYLQQRVLREAKSIDEAFALIQKTNTFSSWTIFISDSKTNEAASIEISANKKVLARRKVNQVMSQSNHFISPTMQKEHFHSNFAAYLESQSRIHQMDRILNDSTGKIDVDWAINALASHIDYFEGERSFGRTAVKLSNIMTSVAYPVQNEFWMTLGDRKPAAHSWYVGSRVDFKNFAIDIISLNRSSSLEKRPSLEKSYSAAVSSYLAYKVRDMKLAISELKKAYELALEDGVDDTSYAYNLARLLMMEGNFSEARGHLEKLLIRKAEFHPYHQALVSLYAARMRQLTHENKNVSHLYSFATDIFQRISDDTKNRKVIKTPDAETAEFEEARFGHGQSNLKAKLKLIETWAMGKNTNIPDLDFGIND